MSLPSLYHALIDWIGDGTGLPDTILHIHAGMALLLITRVVTGRSLGTLIPLSVVAIAEATNEVLDRLYFGSWRWPDTLSDIANTLFWPAVICLAVRVRPLIYQRLSATSMIHPCNEKTVVLRPFHGTTTQRNRLKKLLHHQRFIRVFGGHILDATKDAGTKIIVTSFSYRNLHI